MTRRGARRSRGGAALLAVGLALGASAGCDKRSNVQSREPPREARAAAPRLAASSSATVAPASAAGGAGYAALDRDYAELDRDYASASRPNELGDWRARMAGMHRQMMYMQQHLAGRGAMRRRGMMGGHGMMGGGMMGGGMMGSRGAHHGMMGSGMTWQRDAMMGDWHREMAVLNQQAAEQARKAGDTKLAEQHEAIAKRHLEMAKAIESAPRSKTPAPAAAPVAGEGMYLHACASCHQAHGQGVPGTFPPLAGSPIVQGPPERLVRIVLAGLVGSVEIGGHSYYGAMPAFAGGLDDAQLSHVMSYIRSSWGNKASAVSADQVVAVRKVVASRGSPFTTKELGLEP